MARFLVRVELHSAKGSDYGVLHAAMKQRGFSQQVVGSSGATYHLPTAEYYIVSSKTGPQIRALAAQAVKATKLKGAVLVAKADQLFWSGLPKV